MFIAHVSADDLKSSFEFLCNCYSRGTRCNVIIGMEENIMVFTLPGGSIRIPGKGKWHGEVAALFAPLKALGQRKLKTDPVKIVAEGDLLQFGTFSDKCVTSSGQLRKVDLPVYTKMLDFLRVGHDYSAEEISFSGLGWLIGKVEEKKDILIHRAHILLSKFNVSEEDIRKLVEKGITGK